MDGLYLNGEWVSAADPRATPLNLQSAIEYWEDKKRDDFADVLDDMRKNGHILWRQRNRVQRSARQAYRALE